MVSEGLTSPQDLPPQKAKGSYERRDLLGVVFTWVATLFRSFQEASHANATANNDFSHSQQALRDKLRPEFRSRKSVKLEERTLLDPHAIWQNSHPKVFYSLWAACLLD